MFLLFGRLRRLYGKVFFRGENIEKFCFLEKFQKVSQNLEIEIE